MQCTLQRQQNTILALKNKFKKRDILFTVETVRQTPTRQ